MSLENEDKLLKNISFKHEGNHHYMVISHEGRKSLPFQINMIRYNDLDSLLDVSFFIDNGIYQYFYDVSDQISLESFMQERKYKLSQIRSILGSLYRLVNKLEDFMLDADSLILNPAYIFTERNEMDISFCYYPDYEKPFSKSLEMLFDTFMNHLDYQDNRAVSLVYQAYQSLRKENATLGQIMKLFEIVEEDIEEERSSAVLYEEEESYYEAENTVEEDTDTGKIQISFPLFQQMAHCVEIFRKLALVISGAALLYLYENRGGITKDRLIATVLLMAGCIFFAFMRGDEEKKDVVKVDTAEDIPEEETSIEEQVRENGISLPFLKKEREEPFLLKKRQGEDFEELSFERSVPSVSDQSEKKDKIPATIVLNTFSAENQIYPVLKYEGDKKLFDISIDRADLIIGKVRGIAGVLLEDKGISRIHARVCEKDGKYYLYYCLDFLWSDDRWST